MDNLLEILIPLIFAAIYFFGNMLSGKSEDDEESPSSSQRRRSSGDDGPDAAERQRRIQEEIRRKIMERRRASGGGEATAGPSARELRRDVTAQREERQTEAQPREVVREKEEVPSAYSMKPHEGSEESREPTFTWDQSDNSYETSMQAKLRRIEETRKTAAKLKKEAGMSGDLTSDSGSKKSGRRRTGGYFTGTVRESLQDPAAARVAFIYSEVIGPPITLRKGSSGVPGLN